MKAKEIIAIIILCIIFFIPLFLRPVAYPVNGMDSYCFLNYIWGVTNQIPESAPLSYLVMSVLPPNILFIKLLMLLITIFSILIFCKAGEHIKPGYSILIALILLSNLFFNKLLIRFEDDIFGLPFIALSIYFMVKYLYKTNKQDKKQLYLSLFFWGVSCLFWKFSVYLIFLYLFWTNFNIETTLISIFTGTIFYKQLWNGLVGNLLIVENSPIVGILVLFIPMLFFLYSKKTNPKYDTIKYALWFSLLLLILNVKFVLLIYPFLAIHYVLTIEKQPETIKIINYIVLIVIFLIATMQNFTAPPNNQYIDLIHVAKSEQKLNPNKEINVSWDFGYLYSWETKQYYPIYGHIQPTIEKGIVIQTNAEPNNCPIIYKNKVGYVEKC